MRKSTLLILICMVSGLVVLCGLGTWQVKRLLWKEDLIARVEARLQLQPQPLQSFLKSETPFEDKPYTPVIVEGEFDHSKEVYFYATSTKNGAAGWNVHTPMKLDTGETLIVNRGFVSYELKDPLSRSSGQVEGRQQIMGLIRVPPREKPNSFVPENALVKREFYWRSLPQMVELMKVDSDQKFIEFIVDADDTPFPGASPQGGTTIVSFSNNHLQYAITWYGLALTLLGVGTFFLISRRQEQNG